MTIPQRLISLLLLASLAECRAQATPVPTAVAPSGAAVAQARAEAEAMRRALGTLPPQCIVGDARAAAGHWTAASHAQGVSGTPDLSDGQTAQAYSFARPLVASAVEATMNGAGWALLDKVEVRGADGRWHAAWSGPGRANPSGCAWVLLRQRLGATAQADAVRLVFRHALGNFTAGNVGLLPAP